MAQDSQEKVIGSVLVVGAGVAGIRAALDLAEVGYRVLLTDASAAIGGILSKLDYQFPSDHCGMCKMLPVVGREYASQYCMRKSLFHDNIKIMPFTELREVSGEPGAFQVKLLKRARHVDTDVCIGTGKCAEVCPIEVADEFNQGLTRRKAIFQPVPHNLPNMYLIDMNACDRCGECVKVCPVDAINLEAQDEELEVAVDAVILAAGSGLYDPSVAGDLSSYGVSPNVVTALEFERLLSGSGSYDGVIHRPSDGRPAKRIAWLQCVGSRERARKRDYCSSICCMFALKEAVLAHEKGGDDVETTIFYMDMRTFGKDFYRYREQAERDHGVKLVRCRVHTVEAQQDGTLGLRYADPTSGEFARQDFDVVVLSTGQNPQETARLAQLLQLPRDQGGAVTPQGFDKVRSGRDGVFMCGSFTGLTDIGEALTSGSAAASEASKLMASLKRPFKAEPDLPAERDVSREPARAAVLLCRWNNGKMPDGIDVSALRDGLLERPGVGEVHVVDTLCRGAGYEQAAEILQNMHKTGCNRVVFAACLPYIYRQRLKLLAQQAGLSPSLVEVVDIRSTIQRQLTDDNSQAVLRKVERQVIVALEKARAAEPLELQSIPMNQQALVVGGGVAGMRAALSLAQRGVQVHLVERRDELGGRPLRRLHTSLEGLDPKQIVAELQQQVWESKRVTVHKPAVVVSHQGSLGAFRTEIKNGEDDTLTVLHGATIVATGGTEAATTEYAHGQSEQVVTQAELEHGLATGTIDPSGLETVVMIQCVGSRQQGKHNYCSRVCCAAALKNAFRIREANPDARILVLYRDMMTYGQLEQHYSRARGEGILFSPYELDAPPEVELEEGAPVVRFTDPVLRRPVQVKADLLVLSTAIEAERSNDELARIFGLELTPDGFFQEAESKWRPVDFLKEGVFLAGTAHSPRPIGEALTQAEAAAQRAFTYLSRQQVSAARVVSRVHHSLCSRCEACVAVCPYEARQLDPLTDRIVVDPAACQGCGMCAAACPNSAAELPGVSERQTMAVIEATLG